MRGEVRFSIQTQMAKRLLEYMAEEGITAYEPDTGDGKSLFVRVTGRDKNRLCRLLQKYGLSYCITDVCGSERVKKTIKAHPALFLGAVFGVLLIYLLSLRVWVIDIENAPEEMKEAVRSIGIRPGIRKSCVDVNAVSRQLEAQFRAYSHIGVKLSGVKMKIRAVEASPAPGVYRIEEERNLTARESGVIVNVSVFAGQAAVAPGDTVMKGEVVIFGAERADKDGALTPVRAQGSVMARVWTEAGCAVELEGKSRRPTGRMQEEIALITPFFTHPLTEKCSFSEYDREIRECAVVGLYIPVRLQKTRCYECIYEEIEPDTETAKQKAGGEALKKARLKAPEGAQEADFWIDFDLSETDAIAARAVVEWIMDIATDGG